ncbi:NAD-dependent epimerase/dehydratase family protein [Halohasta salina]|uniref:NAD-dependent epimerase/dehydratase family protein n=1 Tax=Halohasta salina TaxID=2961621 RepID=UPI0020A2747A|nr:NAD-dependent epimerase/dehydratase family protein [Halohasta salina]
MQSRNVLVTGGAGFIGSEFVEKLSETEANVLVVDNCFAGSESLVPDGVAFEQVDIQSNRLSELVSDFDPNVIVHLAAIHYIPYCNEHPEEAFDVNVMGTRNLLTAARELSNLEMMMFASSAAVYPPREGSNSESSETGPTDIYGKTKLIGENLVRQFQQETNTTTAVARLFNVYGPNETNEHLIPAVLNQVRSGDRKIELGNLTPKRDFIHVSDVADALMTLLTEFDDGYGVYNIGTGSEYSVQEVVEKTSEALEEEIDIIQDKDRVRESDRPHLQADISKMQSDFGWEPKVEFVEGLRELLHQNKEVLVT